MVKRGVMLEGQRHQDIGERMALFFSKMQFLLPF